MLKSIFGKSKLPSVYAVVLKGDRLPTKSEVQDSIVFFVRARKLDNVSPFGSRNRIVPFCDPNMETNTVDGDFMVWIGQYLLGLYPDLNQYITISNNRFESNDLDINVVGAKFPSGYIRIVHMKSI